MKNFLNFLLDSLPYSAYWACLVLIPLILGLCGSYEQAYLILTGTAVLFVINLLERMVAILKKLTDK